MKITVSKEGTTVSVESESITDQNVGVVLKTLLDTVKPISKMPSGVLPEMSCHIDGSALKLVLNRSGIPKVPSGGVVTGSTYGLVGEQNKA